MSPAEIQQLDRIVRALVRAELNAAFKGEAVAAASAGDLDAQKHIKGIEAAQNRAWRKYRRFLAEHTSAGASITLIHR